MSRAGSARQAWRLAYGGLSKLELRALLASKGIRLNAYAETLFESPLFETAPARLEAEVIELSVGDMGFTSGATLASLLSRCVERGFAPCPMEIGPYLRLTLKDQEERVSLGSNRAPDGSITILSEPFAKEDEYFPKGFYIRKIGGKLWLRGYVCPMDYLWEPESRIAVISIK